jgi:hypothetical protein
MAQLNFNMYDVEKKLRTKLNCSSTEKFICLLSSLTKRMSLVFRVRKYEGHLYAKGKKHAQHTAHGPNVAHVSIYFGPHTNDFLSRCLFFEDMNTLSN